MLKHKCNKVINAKLNSLSSRVFNELSCSLRNVSLTSQAFIASVRRFQTRQHHVLIVSLSAKLDIISKFSFSGRLCRLGIQLFFTVYEKTFSKTK